MSMVSVRDIDDIHAHLIALYCNRTYPDYLDKPILVLCNLKKHAATLRNLLAYVAEKEGYPTGRIRTVTADTVADQFHQAFVHNPARVVHNCDVLLATSAIQAGISIETHFYFVVDIFFNHILKFGDEQQLQCRYRHNGRDARNHAGVRWSYIAPPCREARLLETSKVRLKQLLAENTTRGVSRALTIAATSLQLRENDTWRRHDFLHKRAYSLWNIDRQVAVAPDDEKWNKVDDGNWRKLRFVERYNKEWCKKRVKRSGYQMTQTVVNTTNIVLSVWLSQPEKRTTNDFLQLCYQLCETIQAPQSSVATSMTSEHSRLEPFQFCATGATQSASLSLARLEARL